MTSIDFQEAKKLAQPYVAQVSLWIKPHVDKTRVFLKPYTKKVTRGYRKFMKSVVVYRQQVYFLLFFPLPYFIFLASPPSADLRKVHHEGFELF